MACCILTVPIGERRRVSVDSPPEELGFGRSVDMPTTSPVQAILRIVLDRIPRLAT